MDQYRHVIAFWKWQAELVSKLWSDLDLEQLLLVKKCKRKYKSSKYICTCAIWQVWFGARSLGNGPRNLYFTSNYWEFRWEMDFMEKVVLKSLKVDEIWVRIEKNYEIWKFTDFFSAFAGHLRPLRGLGFVRPKEMSRRSESFLSETIEKMKIGSKLASGELAQG